MRLRIFTVLIVIFFVRMANAQTDFENELTKILSEPEYKNATIGIHVLDMGTGETVFGFNEHQLMIPASTIKLVTTATAYELLGEDYRFETKIGFTGKINNSKLNGDLVVIGGGDPAMGSEYFKESYFNPHFMDVWAQKIKAFGIQQIDGNLVLDASIYNDDLIPDTWIWGDIGNYYGAYASAFTIYDNMYRVTFESPKQAGKQTKIISIDPKIDSLKIANKVISSDISRDLAYIYGSPLDDNREIRGSIPKNRKSFKVKGSTPDPKEFFANELITHLALNGVFISGKVVFHKIDRKKLMTAYIQQSPTLGEITEVLNHESVNLFAEHLLKQISSETQGQGIRDSSVSIVQRFWKDKIPDYFFMEDGSGLSHFNAVSANDITAILNYMYNQSGNKKSFVSSLPMVGEGTLSGFSTELFPGETLRAKSGSMTRVRCYAGYLKTDKGSNLAFSIMFNNFDVTQSEIIKDIERLLYRLKSV